MSDEELIHYLITHKNVCGRFSSNQLNRQLEERQETDYRHPRKRIWPRLVLPAFLSTVAVELEAQNQDSTMIHQSINYRGADTSSQDLRKITIIGKIIEEDSTALIGVFIEGRSKTDTSGCVSDFDGNFKLVLLTKSNDSIGLKSSLLGYEKAYFTIVLNENQNVYETDIVMKQANRDSTITLGIIREIMTGAALVIVS